MDHRGKHPQQQNQREETQRKRKERKRSAPAAAADELSRSKTTQCKGNARKRQGPDAAAAEERSRKKMNRSGRASRRKRMESPGKEKCFRDFTEEEHLAYMKKYDESDGFDVEIPDGVLCPGISTPINVDCPPCELPPKYNEMSELALDEFNKQHGTTFKFVKFIKGNGRFTTGMWYRLTFQAEDQKSASPQNFQTLVFRKLKDIKVHFCRFEPKGLGVGETSQQ